MNDLTANFDELLSEEPEEKEVLFDFKDELQRGFTNEVLGYWNKKPIFYQMDQYICVLGSKRKLLLINTNYDGLTKHGHLHIRVDSNNKIDLSTVIYIFETCLKKHQFPKSSYTWTCCMRLTDDEDYREYLIRKKARMKDKTKYRNDYKKR